MTTEPLFIVGCPRSGTSVLRRILQLDPGVRFTPETHYMYQAQAHVVGITDEPARMRAMWATYQHDHHFTRLKLPPEAVAYLGEQTTSRGFFETLMQAHAAKSGSEVLGEKTPTNFHYLETLLDWFPNAHVFYAVRDPRAVVSSLLALDLAWAPASLAEAVRSWTAAADAYWQWVGDPRVTLIRYEDLMADVAGEATRLFTAVGRRFDPAWLDAAGDPDVAGMSNGSLSATGKISADRVQAWRERLRPRQVATVEALCRSRMTRFGYMPESGHGAPTVVRARAVQAAAVARRGWRVVREPGRVIGRLRA